MKIKEIFRISENKHNSQDLHIIPNNLYGKNLFYYIDKITNSNDKDYKLKIIWKNYDNQNKEISANYNIYNFPRCRTIASCSFSFLKLNSLRLYNFLSL